MVVRFFCVITQISTFINRGQCDPCARACAPAACARVSRLPCVCRAVGCSAPPGVFLPVPVTDVSPGRRPPLCPGSPRCLFTGYRGAVDSGLAAVLAADHIESVAVFVRVCVVGFGWMVVRFVRVIRLPACARVSRVSRVCPGSPPVSFYRYTYRLPRCLFTGYRTKIMCGGALMFALVGAAAQMRVRIDFYGECV